MCVNIPRRKIIVLIFCFVNISSCLAQKSKLIALWNRVFNDTTTTAKAKFITYPVVAFTPETSWEFGASSLYLYHSKNDLNNRLSEINAFTFITLENQYGIWLDHAIYTDENNYFLLGKFRLQQFPLLFYGIGLDTPSEPVARIDGFSIALRERFLRKLKNDLYLGFEFDYSRLSSVQITEQESLFTPPPGTEGFTNYGFGMGVVFDQRYNVLNPRKGFFVEGGFLHYNKVFGSDFSFNNYFLDFRHYLPVNKNQILAFQLFANTVSEINGSQVPFNQISLIGGESLMRGYYLGRYRDNTSLVLQKEYRFLPFPFSKRLGGAIFSSIGTLSNSIQNIDLRNIRVTAGTGLRYLLFPGKDIYTRLDVAFTQEGSGIYIFIGEAF